MKAYPVKYDIDQTVFIMKDGEVFKSKVEKIRILEERKSIISDAPDNRIEDAKKGLTIEYLIEFDSDKSKNSTYLKWYNQRDVFPNKAYLLEHIKKNKSV